MTRHDATVQLAADVARIGADGVVVSSMDLRVHDRECPSPAGSRFSRLIPAWASDWGAERDLTLPSRWPVKPGADTASWITTYPREG
jgi:hypothetical protein